MPTERLYYLDPDLLSFEASISSLTKAGDVWSCQLDRSAFYPTSGGQLHDLGRLGDAEVLEVVETDDGEVIHRLGSSPGEPGEIVRCEIEPARRRRNRQLHTAQHILSQAFIQSTGLETVSVHLGEHYGAIELPRHPLGEHDLRHAEQLTDQIVRDALPVEILMVTPQEASRMPLRKQPSREGIIRIIRIGEFDYSACGGTHCRSTQDVGLIQITGTEKLRGNTLVTFLAGDMAVADYRIRLAITQSLSSRLTCGITDITAKVDHQLQENAELRAVQQALHKELLPHTISRLAAGSEMLNGRPVLLLDHTAAGTFAVNQLAGELSRNIAGVVIVTFPDRLTIASALGPPLDARTLVQTLTTTCNLRGGGSPQIAQIGGISDERLPELLNLIRKHIAESN